MEFIATETELDYQGSEYCPDDNLYQPIFIELVYDIFRDEYGFLHTQLRVL